MSLFYAVQVSHAYCLLGRGVSARALFLDTGSLTSELAQIVKLGAANLTYLVDFDAVDVGRLQGNFSTI